MIRFSVEEKKKWHDGEAEPQSSILFEKVSLVNVGQIIRFDKVLVEVISEKIINKINMRSMNARRSTRSSKGKPA